ncbi:RelB protein [Crenothrix polyspora]|uniref:Relaxosome protein TraY n=2 Tax=Crenothrix polyspora TaxID=360316 RepID=A0A1R4HHC4_9GAMM|nr:RelB protein [Crenothrix polyspora]
MPAQYFYRPLNNRGFMTISIQLPVDVEAKLEHLATLTGRSKVFYVTEAILEHLDDIEDLYLVERELDAIRDGVSVPIPHIEMIKHYAGMGCP